MMSSLAASRAAPRAGARWRSRLPRWAALLGSAAAAALAAWAADVDPARLPPAAKGPVDFARDAAPILERSCLKCHGPERPKGGLRLDRRDTALKGGENGAIIVPGDSARSRLIHLVSHALADLEMPPKGRGEPLTPAEVGRLRGWIDQGAAWPEGLALKAAADGKSPASTTHWAYVKPVSPPLPRVRHQHWARNPIDRFILARLEKAGRRPTKEASRETLIRRVSLDLTGLPPTLAEVDAFLKDARPGAYERVVERLLASPHYGERWARPWLDMARYADTNGYEKDDRRTNWKYRDWVIAALNRDLPFDQFTIEQLAGDLLPNATIEQKIATGFHRNTMVNTEGGTDEEEFRVAALVDRVNTTFTVWMGTTMACAQCHDHKYDPFTQKDYYQAFAFLNQTRDKGRSNEPELELPTPEQAAKRADVRARIAPLQQVLDTQTPELDTRLAAWEAKARTNLAAVAAGWQMVTPTELSASGGIQLAAEAEHTVFSSGARPDTTIYEITAQPQATNISAVRLEALLDPRLPGGSSGRGEDGEFVLTEAVAAAVPVGAARPAKPPTPTLSKWQLIGPFTAASGAEAFSTAFPPEKEIALEKSYAEGRLKWTERADLADGKVQPLKGENCATYLYRTVTAPEACRVWAWVGSDDGLQVWLNGQKLLSRDVSRAVAPDQDLVPLDLVKGENRLLMKVNNGGGDYGFYFALSEDPDTPFLIKFDLAYADFSEERFEVAKAIDGDSKTGWAIAANEEKNRTNRSAVFVAKQPFRLEPAKRLVLRLKQEANRRGQLLGRFRLSLSTAPGEALRAVAAIPAGTRALLEIPPDKREAKQKAELASYYRSVDPELDKVRARIAEIRKEEPKDILTTLVIEAVEKPRETHVLVRGSHLNPGGLVGPGVPAVLPPIPTNAPSDRLTFARWVASPENPLVGRVTMNRLWAAYFGRGIVETSEDFGVQGEPPTHPELLDWLATEFVRRDWSLKAMHWLIVGSAVYRQASEAGPHLVARDPYNRLYARGPRFRLEAEMLRDTALAVSGLLTRRVGGPSVFPAQPEGIWNLPYNSDRWETSKDGDQFRRGLYTFCRRSAPYAAFVSFDAPSREVCTERRLRSNTPVQALVTLNDPAFVVAANALGRQALAEGGRTPKEKLVFAFRLAMARRPSRAELRPLLRLYEEGVRRFTGHPTQVEALLSVGLPKPATLSPELAAWVVVANVLLNLDEALTKG